jgi:hypothetical protein
MFEQVGPVALSAIVRDLLYQDGYASSEEVEQFLGTFGHDEADTADATRARVFVPRGATGRRAEEKFLDWFNADSLPFAGEIRDRREDGCGYDFHVSGQEELLIEVKGLAGREGGILLTDKEWETAKEHRNYRVFLVYDLNTDTPEWAILDNAASLRPRRSVRTVVQVNWHLTGDQLGLGVV